MIIIKDMEDSDIVVLANLWLEVSIEAHDFISPDYWKENYTSMKDLYLPNAEVYVAKENGTTLGFLALMENHIASIFVASSQQGKGVGKQLIGFAKEIRNELSLNVYQKNLKSVNFYQRNNFEVVSTSVDDATQESEFVMKWIKL